MKNIFLLIIISAISLFAYADADMDGVEDKLDKCPNTSLTDLVDINGCTKQSLVSNHHFDIIVGASYEETDYDLIPKSDTISTTLQMDYYYKNFSIQVASSYFETNSGDYSDNGFNDTTTAIYYALYPTNALSVKLGIGAILPTYSSDLDNNNVDYLGSLNISYKVGDFSIFAGYNYNIINDDDIVDANNTIKYRNTNAYSSGIGYNFTPSLYANISYFQSDSIYENVEDVKSASIYMFYSISENWFTNLTYSNGLSKSTSDHYSAIKLGYYF